jgi:purine-binding chemotaxis protein CheW
MLSRSSHDRREPSRPDCMQVVVVSVGEVRFGIDVRSIREITRPAPATAVPNSSRAIVGVFDWRGRVIPLIDLRARFGFPPACGGSARRVIIAEAIGRICGLAVDCVHELRSVDGAMGPVASVKVSLPVAGLAGLNATDDGLILIDCSDLFGPAAIAA